MGKVFVDVGMSLDGFIAGPHGRPGNPLGDGGTRIHEWLYPTATFLSRIGGSGGQTGPDDDLVKAVFARSGASIMGRRMFDEGEVGWPENAPFHTPVFVLTHKPREAWVRPGGTTFFFVTDGIESALNQVRNAAGDLDVRIAGGADTIRQYLKAGAMDDVTLHVAPVLMGRGVRLFDGMTPHDLKLEPTSIVHSPLVTHISYKVVR